jgi:multiple sugar transport system substrate-binding protein
MRKAVALGFAVLLVLLPVGCKKAERDGKTTLTFVTWKPNQPQAWDEAVRIFEEENPGIAVVREVGPHSSTAFHDLLTQKLKNRSTDVDVFFMDVIWPPEFAAAGWAMPLDGLFPPEEREKFLPGSILANSYKGSVYGVPLFVDSGILYFRRDLLDEYGLEPPATWQEMVDRAEAVVRGEAEKGIGMAGFSGQFKQYEGLVCDMMEFILSNGGSVLDPETGEVGLDKAPAVEAVRFVRESIIGRAAPRGVLTYQEPESLDVFIQGRAVFHRNWPYAWEISNDPERSKVAGRVGIARLPHFPGGESRSTLGGWQLGISAYSRNKEAAWRFVSFLSSPRMQKLIALRAGRAPTRNQTCSSVISAGPYPSPALTLRKRPLKPRARWRRLSHLPGNNLLSITCFLIGIWRADEDMGGGDGLRRGTRNVSMDCQG